MSFNRQVHIEPHKTSSNSEYIEMHTYDVGSGHDMALVTVHGCNMDQHDQTVELWLTEDEVKAIRDGLNLLLKEES